MDDDLSPYQEALKQAKTALKVGDIVAARHWAQQAARLDANQEDPWLILAAVSSPRASLVYLNRALEVNPNSERARKGMHWAIQRFRSSTETPRLTAPAILLPTSKIPDQAYVRKQPFVLAWFLPLFLVIFLILAWYSYPAISSSIGPNQPMALAQNNEKATRTPLPTFTNTPEPTNTPLPPVTETPTLTLTPTDTPIPLPTDTPFPTASLTEESSDESGVDTAQEPEPTQGPDGRYERLSMPEGQRWIDVDLSQQRVYAFEGEQIVDTFRVSTGKSQTPTVTGKFKIYVKYRSADMSGSDYFLADVPYVMYFYRDYGLHGTYWHTNFGTPMSHGCVNLKTKDAKWLFDWASVGTVVFVHR